MKEIHHIHLSSIPSTQDYLRELLLRDEEVELTLITTGEQTAGYGRQENSWLFESGNLAMSFLLDSSFGEPLSLKLGVCLAEFLDLKLKWPNDLINLEGKKCGGIIVQKVKQRWVVGVGLNFVPTADYGFIKKTCDLQELAQEIYERVLTMEQENIMQRFETLCVHMNREVRLTRKNETELLGQGVFRGIDKSGFALLEGPEGQIKPYANGSLRET